MCKRCDSASKLGELFGFFIDAGIKIGEVRAKLESYNGVAVKPEDLGKMLNHISEGAKVHEEVVSGLENISQELAVDFTGAIWNSGNAKEFAKVIGDFIEAVNEGGKANA